MRYQLTPKQFLARVGAKTYTAVTLLAICIFAVSARGWFGSRKDSKVIKSPTIAAAAQQNTSKRIAADMEVERITVKPNGLEPSEIRRPAGPFLLALSIHPRLSDVSLEVYPVNGQKLHELRAKKGQPRQQKILDLGPGEYVLKDMNHPEWTCRLFISPR